MADIRLTPGNDVYVQPAADKNLWNTVYGEDGNDTIRMYQGTAIGGKGNDTFERIVDPENPNRDFQVAFWSAGDNLKVNLLEGWAEDGEGGRDTLIGVRGVHGSGAKNAWVQGDNNDNYYFPNGGDDTFIGLGGNDGISLNSWFIPAPGAQGRSPLLSEMNINVSADGSSATITPKFGTDFRINVTGVEYFDAMVDVANNTWNRFYFADFITPQSMAEQAIAAGGSARWNAAQALGSAVSLTYSFVTQGAQPGFRAFTPAEQQLVRDILAKTAAVTQLTFTEVTEAGATVGQLRFGVSQQAATKGQAFLPGQSGDQAGDVWMDVESMAGIAQGTEGYQALLHEIGHALGLRHPRNVDAGDAWTVQLRAADDRLSLSVMSNTASSDGLFRADWGPLDVMALRYLYGTRMANASDTTYMLGARESAAMTTVIDDGGTDTLDASRSANGVSLDLVPGHLGSVGITPAGVSGVENLGLAAGTLIENAIGSAFDDVLLGNDADNSLTGGLGNDWIDGGAGTDSALFSGKRVDYELSNAYGKLYVRARDGTSGFDTLVNIERLVFSDQSVALASKVLSADNSLVVDEDTRLTASLPDPGDVARNTVTYKLIGTSAQGTATISADGQLSYMPKANFWGQDTISYEISQGGFANRYLSFVNVLPVNDGPPVAKTGAYLVPGTNNMKGQLPAATDADGDTISYALATDSKNGGVVIVHGNGSFSYQAKSGFLGADNFSFIVSDGYGGTNVYNVALTVVDVAGLREGTEGADTLAAQASADGYLGFGGNDLITGGGGNDLIDGGSGIDTAGYLSGRALYNLTKTDYGWSVVATGGSEGSDILTNIERLQFTNTSLALDLDGNAGSVAQIIRALFGKDNLSNKTFVGIGLQLFDAGMSYADVVKLAVGTDIFAQLAGGRSNTAFVNFVYKNVIGIPAPAGDLALYVGLLDSGAYTQDSLALAAAQISFNTGSVDLTGLASTGIEFTPQG